LLSLFCAHLTGELSKDRGLGADLDLILILMRDLLTRLARV